MSLIYNIYTFPNIACATHQAFMAAVKTYMHTLVNHNAEAFKQVKLEAHNIHTPKQETKLTDKLLAPFWQNNQLGLMAYTEEGIALAKVWLELMQAQYPHLVSGMDVSEKKYTPSIRDTCSLYQSEFWAPMRSAHFQNGFWYYKTLNRGTLLADFNTLLNKGIASFFSKYHVDVEQGLWQQDHFWLAIKHMEHTKPYASLGYKSKHKHRLFKIQFETNLHLPEQLHLGQAIGYGNGFFKHQAIEKPKTT